MAPTIIIYRRTATASTYLMRAFGGVYATTPPLSVDLSQRCFNTEYEPIVRHILTHKTGKVVVINLVRNPFTRFASQMFKNLTNQQIRHPTTGEWMACPFYAGGDFSFENLSRIFKEAMRTFLIPYDHGIQESYPRLFGVDLNQHEFDYDHGLLSFESARFVFLTLRQEDTAAWPAVLGRRLGAWRASLRMLAARQTARKVNAAADRNDAAQYDAFRREYVYTDAEQSAIRSLPTYTRYYADDKGRPPAAR